MRTLVLLCCIAISGCSTLQSILLPTPVPCAPKDSPTPPKITSDTLLAKMDDRHLVLIIASERLDLIDYAGKADAIISACK